jgi:tRNA wybutosine-synthesizing protein 4
LCSDTKFIDVDYELLMETKRDIIMNQPEMRDLLTPTASDETAHDQAVKVDTAEYAAIGCDLRNLRKLDRLLKSVADLEHASILCLAEDSTTFMPVKAADALIWWTAGLSAGQCGP